MTFEHPEPRVGVLVGSLSSGSINRQLADALEEFGPGRFEPITITGLSLYSTDAEADFPPAAAALKHHLAQLDGVLFVTPEYNRSIPAALKNAVDWGTRPYGDNAWAGLPAAVIGAGLSGAGTAVAQAHLRSVLGYLGMVVLGAPETCVTWRDGVLAEPGTRTALRDFLDAFDRHVRATMRTSARSA